MVEAVRAIYGPAALVPVARPAVLDTTFRLAGGQFETYRMFIIAVGFALMVAISLLLQRTRLGIIIRAGVQDREMVEALGINVRRVSRWSRARHGRGRAGRLRRRSRARPRPGAIPLIAVIVIVIGGMSSYEGTAIASVWSV
jgi:branched-chain amino acid transport system permease protein